MLKNIETERLLLRKWKLSDYKDMFEYAKSDLVGPNAGWTPHKNIDESKDIIKSFIESNEVLAIELKSENKVIGGIGLHDRKPDNSIETLKQKEIGYVLNPEYWGNGYIPEAVKSLIKFGFSELDLEYIWCSHFEDNLRSKRVIEKCGFRFKFKKNEIKELLCGKEVVSLYYNINKKIRIDDLENEDVKKLVNQHVQKMVEGSPIESVHALNLDRLKGDDITFYTLWINNNLAGCRALKQLDGSHGEIKSMRTHENYLKLGVAQAILSHIISVAKNRGYSRLSLETGTSSSFIPAHNLYKKNGFTICEPFSDYFEDKNSYFMKKELLDQ